MENAISYRGGGWALSFDAVLEAKKGIPVYNGKPWLKEIFK